MYLSPQISLTSLWMLATAFMCVLLLFAIYMLRVRKVAVYRRRTNSERPEIADADYLPASVVIYSQGDAEDLEQLVKTILGQDYPAAFEVIVVNEGESTDVRDTVSMLRASHNNLYLTFTPEGVVNLSRKKLALTLGIKAARYDVVVLTTTAVDIESPQWLRHIMSRFDREGQTEIVLGYAYVDPDEDCSFGCRRRAFDNTANNVRWIANAIAGKPFRGTEYNIAYRKEVFMRNKGFARSLNLHNGDDDIFISEVAHRGNTVVELSDESMVRLRHGNHPRIFSERMLRRAFTERFIKHRPRFLFSLMGWLQIAAIASAAAAAWLDYPNMQTAIIGAIILVLMFALDIWAWRASLQTLKSRTMFFTLPWFSITYPLRQTWRGMRSRSSKQKKYTWD